MSSHKWPFFNLLKSFVYIDMYGAVQRKDGRY